MNDQTEMTLDEALQEIDGVVRALNLERDTDIPGLPWWLPAEPGPIECATLGEAVTEALELGVRRLGLMDGTDWVYHYDTDEVWIDGRRYVAAPPPTPLRRCDWTSPYDGRRCVKDAEHASHNVGTPAAVPPQGEPSQ